MLLLKRGGH